MIIRRPGAGRPGPLAASPRLPGATSGAIVIVIVIVVVISIVTVTVIEKHIDIYKDIVIAILRVIVIERPQALAECADDLSRKRRLDRRLFADYCYYYYYYYYYCSYCYYCYYYYYYYYY